MRYRKLVAAFDEHIKNLTNGELDYARELLSRVSEIIDAPKERREDWARGFGYVVLDNYEFAESDLGQALIKFCDDFVDCGRKAIEGTI